MGDEATNSLLNQIKEMLNGKLDSVQREVNKNTDSKFLGVQNVLREIQNENKDTRERVEKNEERINKLETREQLDERKVSLIVFGVQGEYLSDVMNQILLVVKEIGIDMNKYQIKRMFKLGRKKWSEEGPLKIVLTSSILRNDILKNKHKIKSNNQIKFKEDLSKEEQQTRTKLVKFSLAAKSKGENVHMKNDKLVINGKSWTLQQLEEEEISNQEDFEMKDSNLDNTIITITEVRDKNLKRTYAEHSPISSTQPQHASTPISKKGRTNTLDGKEQKQMNLQDMWSLTPKNNQEIENKNKTIATNDLF